MFLTPKYKALIYIFSDFGTRLIKLKAKVLKTLGLDTLDSKILSKRRTEHTYRAKSRHFKKCFYISRGLYAGCPVR